MLGKRFWFQRKVKAVAKKPPPTPLSTYVSCWKPPSYKSPFESGRAFISFLQKKGFKVLGSGAYSCVLAKGNSKRVIKVCNTPDDWMSYITWAAKKGYAGSFAPRVYSYKLIQGNKQPFYIASVERMAYTINRVKGNHDMAFMPKLVTYALSHDNDNAKRCIDLLSPGLSKFTEDFKKDFEGQRYDLHGDNFMIREDNSFVLTDPLCGTLDITTPKRLRTKDLCAA